MASGYDKFFKEAQKASGLSSGGSSGKKATSAQPQKGRLGSKASRATPEDRLREELALRMRRRKSQSLRRKKKFPLYPVACTIAALITCGIGYRYIDVVDEFINKIEFSAFGTADAAETEKKPEPAKKQEKTAASGEPTPEKAAGTKGTTTAREKEEAPPAKAAAAGYSPEEVSFFSKLNERKKELDLREADLNKLEEELQKRKSELDQKLKALESMRAEISKTLKSRVANDQQKVDKLVDFYSTMKPQQAAKVIESLNEDLAVEILDKMKKKNAAEVLNTMNAKKARRLSELMTGYERSTASVDGEANDPADLPAQDPKPQPEAKAAPKNETKSETKKENGAKR